MKDIHKETYLYEQLKTHLVEIILNNQNNTSYRLPTEDSLTKEFNISRITVRKAFDKLVNEGLLVRYKGRGTYIADNMNIEKLNEYKNILQKQKHKQKKIGIIVPSFDSEQIMRLFASIHNYLASQGLNNIIFQHAVTFQNIDKEIEAINQFSKEDLDGLLVYPVDGTIYNPALIRLILNNFPVVLIDRAFNGIESNFVTSDHQSIFTQAVNLLCQKGHKNIAIFSAHPFRVSVIEERIIGYEKGMKKNNLPIDINYEILAKNLPQNAEIKEVYEEHRRCTEEIKALILSNKIKAVICSCYTSSVLMLRLMDQLEKQYIAIKNKISVIYCDLDEGIREFTYPSPTCIIQNSDVIGEEAIKLLLKLIDNSPLAKTTITVPCYIMQGNTLHDKY